MENIGLHAQFDLRDYDANAARYIRTQAEAQTSTDRASVAMTSAGVASTRAASGYNVFSIAASGVHRAISNIVAVISKILSFFANLVSMAVKAAAAITVVAFAIGKLDKLLLFIAKLTQGIPVVSNMFKQLAIDYQAVGGSAGAADSLTKRILAIVGLGGALVGFRNIWKALRGDVEGAGKGASTAGGGFLNLSRSITNVNQGAGGLSIGAIALGTALGNILVNAVRSVWQAFTNLDQTLTYISEQTFVGMAARAREFMSVLIMMGAKQGITATEIDKNVQAIRALGIEMNVAQNLVQQAIRYNISLADAQILARTAQDAAVVGQTNSSEALDRLVWGITTQQTEILRTMGLNVRFEESYKELAKELGKSAESLTTNERIQAALNAVKKEAITIEGAYVTAQKDASKEMRSFPRYVNEIQIAMGAPFLGAFDNVIFGLKNLLTTISQLVSTKGPVKDFLYSIGALASVITEPFLNVSKAISEYLKPATRDMVEGTKSALKNMTATAEGEGRNFVAKLISTFSNAAESALRWGVNIVANLAEGMAQGAAWALTSAMNMIGNLISSWLAPGSPPKVAPNIDKWGAATAAEWLGGFKDADFSLLESIQGPLKQVLDVIGKSADFTSLSMGLIESIKTFSATGAVNAALMSQLSGLGGVYGTELAKLVALQFELAKSTKAINDADKKYVDSQTKVSTLTSEYNKMMRSGASKEALKTKLAEINAAEKARDMAAKDKVAAVEKATALQEQAGLQAKLLSQLIELARAQQTAGIKLEAPEKAGGKAEPIEMPEIKVPGIDVAKPIDNMLKEAEKRIREKLASIFAPLKKVWTTIFGEDADIGVAGKHMKVHIPGLIDGLVAKFEWFKGKVKLAWAYIVEALQPAIKAIKELIPPDILNQLGRLGGIAVVVALAIGGISIVVGIVGGILAALTGTVGLVVIAITALYLAWVNNWGGMQTAIMFMWENVTKPVLTALWTFFTVTIPAAIKTLSGFWNNTLLPAFRGVWNFLNTYVIPLFRALADVASAVLGKASEALAGIWQNMVLPALTSVWRCINVDVIPILKSLWEFIDDPLKQVLTFLHDNLLVPIGKAFETIGKAVLSVIGWLKDLADGIRNLSLPYWLTPGSPTPLEEGLTGVGIAASIAAGAFWGSPETLGGALANMDAVLSGAEGLLADFEMLKSIAAGSKGTIGEPLAATLYMVRDAAAEAGSAVGGVWEGLLGLKSMDGQETHFWVFTHEVTIHEPDRTSGGGTTTGGGGGGGGGTTGGGGPPEGWQHGGWAPNGVIRSHSGEYIVSEAMRAGKQPIPDNVFSNAALMRMSAAKPQIVTITRDITVSFPNASIASDMDLANVDNRVRRVVRDEMRRR